MIQDRPWVKVNEFKCEAAGDHTHCLEVPGGHLYRNIVSFDGVKHVTMVFVPQPDKCCQHNKYTHKICPDCLQKLWENQVNNG